MTDQNNNENAKGVLYLDCGLDNVWIQGGVDEIESPYGKGIAIHDLNGLHECIARCLLMKPAPLTGAEFRFLRTELDLSQRVMGGLCGRNERTVRDWESRDEVEEPANFIIRFVYKQRFTPEAQYEQFSKEIQRLQALDKEFHELKLRNTKEEGWVPLNCEAKEAA
jgi:DNA-binding transcriptional regulator YiaG